MDPDPRSDSHAVTERLAASADDVWAVLSAFGDGSWAPVDITVEGEGVGAVRTVAMPTGPVVERCEHLDHKGRELRYRILSGNFLEADEYIGRIVVRQVDGGACEVDWSATFVPTGDVDRLHVDLDRFLRATVEVLRRHLTA